MQLITHLHRYPPPEMLLSSPAALLVCVVGKKKCQTSTACVRLPTAGWLTNLMTELTELQTRVDASGMSP